jgi:pyruvate kinase
VTYTGLPRDVAEGDAILLNDGQIQLRVTGSNASCIQTLVEVGGPLTSHKGVNVPGVTLGIDTITDKDRSDLAWGLDAGVDLVAQSFVRSAGDIARLRELMGSRPVPVVAKVEKHEAVDHMAEVVTAADIVMVARGDLGVETSPEAVPVIQRRLLEACRQRGKPVIVATQMLESMISAPRPTRAEASDVATPSSAAPTPSCSRRRPPSVSTRSWPCGRWRASPRRPRTRCPSRSATRSTAVTAMT